MKRDEVEEFLRRAAARRAQAEAQRRAQQGNPPVRPVTPPVPPQRPGQRNPPGRLAQRLEPEDVVILEPVEAEVIEAEAVGGQRRLRPAVEGPRDGSRQIGSRAPTQYDVDQADEQMETHLHQVFDHQLGNLRKDNIAEGPPPPVAAASDTRVSEAASSIANMLRSPANLRNAIILNEIMTPPRHLW